MTASTSTATWRHGLLFGLLVLFSLLSSGVFACAMPFAALATLAALHLDRRDAVMMIAAAWLANQLWGFLVLDYPRDAGTFAWGGVLLASAVAATLAAEATARGLRRSGALAASGAALSAAFVAYEAVLAAANPFLSSSWDSFAPAMVARIALVNLVAFAALLALHRLGIAIGLIAPAPRHRGTAALPA